MRIAYLINGLNGGGAAFPLIDVVGLMRAEGHEVSLLALRPQDSLAMPRLQAAGIDCKILGTGPGDFFSSLLALIRTLRRDRPDILWTSLTRATIMGQIVGKLLKIPVVSWQHNAFLRKGNRAILRRTKHLTSHWVTDSESVASFAESALGIAREKIDIWPLFIAQDNVPRAQAWTGSGPFRIGSLGRLHPNKQYDVLIRVAARIRALDPELSQRLQFEVAGSGPEEVALRALCKTLRIDNLHFGGFVEAPQSFLAGLHAYIQPSRNEGLCIASHEAMLAGLPTVTTPVGQLKYSVMDGATGYLCAIGDVDAMAHALLTLARDPARAAQMGRAAHERVVTLFGATRFETVGRELLKHLHQEFGIA